MSVAGGAQTADEAWFLYVLHRVGAGAVLYRDVWAPMFPLSVGLATSFTRVFGDHVFVLKAVDSLVFAAMAVAAGSIARRFQPRPSTAYLLLIPLLAWAAPGMVGPGSLYTALSYALLLGTCAVTLAWLDARSVPGGRAKRLLLVAAVLCGLAVSAKQTVGALALGSLLAVVVAVEWRRGTARVLSSALAVCAAAVAAVMATVLPVVLNGGLPAFFQDTLPSAGNVSSFAAGAVPYSSGLLDLARQVGQASSLGRVHWALQVSTSGAYLLPLVALPLMCWGVLRRKDEPGLALAAFVLPGFAAVLVRADFPHFAAAVPLVLLAGLYGWIATRPPARAWLRALALGFAVALAVTRLAALAADPVRDASGRLVQSGLPHYQAALLRRVDEVPAAEAVKELRASPGRSVFILSVRAGFLYLASGRESPTPYDYPDGMTPSAQGGVIRAIERGRIDAVWIDPWVVDRARGRTASLVDYVTDRMRPIGVVTRWGRLYVRSAG